MDLLVPVGLHCMGKTLRHLSVVLVLLLLLLLLLLRHHDGPAALIVAVHDVIAVKVVVIVAKRVDQDLGHLEPAKVENELKKEEEGNVYIKVGVVVPHLRSE